jgi:hypothetical protein
MSHYAAELRHAIDDLIGTKRPFGFNEIRECLEKLLEGNPKYTDSIKQPELKLELLKLFEIGCMPGYALVSKPMVGDDGPYFILEFSPENPMATLDLIDKPESDGQKVSCTIHLYYKNMIKDVAGLADCNQDTLVRSILIKSLNMISDQLK